MQIKTLFSIFGGLFLIGGPIMVLLSGQASPVAQPTLETPPRIDWKIPAATGSSGRKVTIILNWFRRRDAAQQLMEAMNSGDAVKSVWVCAFNSPLQSFYADLVKDYKQHLPSGHPISLEFISSSFNFKYHGRFLLGLMAPSPLLWYVDDDMTWNKQLLPALLLGMEAQNGIISLRGHRLNRKRRPSPTEMQYAPQWADTVAGVEHSKNMPDEWASGEIPAFEVDYGCNSWLLKKRWLWVSHTRK